MSDNYSNLYDVLQTMGCAGLLANAGIALTPAMARKFALHLDLLREWNAFAALVSIRDEALLVESHLVDSLSLAPYLGQGTGDGILLDIGPGGGFPALPLKVAMPGLRLVLVERAERKVGFLRKALAILELDDVRLALGEFPAAVGRDLEPDWITSRAVERPERVRRAILKYMKPGAAYLCQGEPPVVDARFHVEHIEDDWSRKGLRRGRLSVVRRVA